MTSAGPTGNEGRGVPRPKQIGAFRR
jgi:hypothetical protein